MCLKVIDVSDDLASIDKKAHNAYVEFLTGFLVLRRASEWTIGPVSRPKLRNPLEERRFHRANLLIQLCESAGLKEMRHKWEVEICSATDETLLRRKQKSADLSGGRLRPLVEVTLQRKQALKLVDLCNFWAESKLTDFESLVYTKTTRHSMWFMRNPLLPWDIFSLLDILTIERVKSWEYYSANVLGYSRKREVLLLLTICFKLASASLRL